MAHGELTDESCIAADVPKNVMCVELETFERNLCVNVSRRSHRYATPHPTTNIE